MGRGWSQMDQSCALALKGFSSLIFIKITPRGGRGSVLEPP